MNKDKSKIIKTKVKGPKDGTTFRNMLQLFNLQKGIVFKNFKLKFFTPRNSLIVADFQLNTGDFEHHVVQIKDGGFILYGKKYLHDSTYLEYNRTFKMHVSKYHEDLSIPIKQWINAKAIKQKIKNYKFTVPSDVVQDVEMSDIVNNVDPIILQNFTVSTVIQQVLQGAAMGKIFELIKMVVILGTLVSLGSLLLNLKMSGIINF